MPLNSNWKGTYSKYVSVPDGNNANDGSQSLPYENISVAIASIAGGSVGFRGQYSNQAVGSTGSKNISVIFDSFGVIDGFGFLPFATGSLSRTLNFSGRGVGVIKNANDIRGNGGSGRAGCGYYNIAVIDSNNINYVEAQNTFFIRSTITTSVISSPYQTNTQMFKVTCIGTSITDNQSIGPIEWINCLFDKSSSFSTNNNNKKFSQCLFEQDAVLGATINGVKIKDITLNGDATTIGNTYADAEKFSGTATVGGRTVTFTNCFWTADAGFLDRGNDVYDIATTSPAINSRNIIGAGSVSILFDGNNDAFNPANSGVIINNITVDGNGAFSLATAGEGQIKSTDDPSIALSKPFAGTGQLSFAADLIGAQNEAIDNADYNAGINDEVRATVLFRAYDENEPNGVNSQLNWGSWIEIERGFDPSSDSLSLGNGNVDVDFSSLLDINFKRFQLDIRLTDGTA